MPHFFIADKVLEAGSSVVLDEGGDVHHISHVLRKKAGDNIFLADCSGNLWSGVITVMAEDRVVVMTTGIQTGRVVPGTGVGRKIALVQAVPRPGKMDWIVEKATELGVSEIIPVLTQRSWKWLPSRSSNRVDRWKRKGAEAAKLSRLMPPVISEPMSLVDYAAAFRGKVFGVVLWEGEECRSLGSIFKDIDREKNVHFVVGPEGGFDRDEIGLLNNAGFSSVYLPFPVLRVETASLAALSILIYEMVSNDETRERNYPLAK